MSLLLPLLPLLATVGPFATPAAPGLDRPARSRPARTAPVTAPAAPADSPRAGQCRAAIEADANAALDLAGTWLSSAKGQEQAEAGLCLGLAHSELRQWDSAAQAFLAARDAAGANRLLAARLGAMAGSAALAGNAPDKALAALDLAATEARGLSSPALEADIALDRARALVALQRPAEAETALAAARAAAPENAEGWLLSATLARRQNNLAEAQARIERAAALLPIDPAIGLEAGVIAMLSGREDAARKSWQSVLAAAPESAEAQTAQTYLAQLGPAPAGTANPAKASIGR